MSFHVTMAEIVCTKEGAVMGMQIAKTALTRLTVVRKIIVQRLTLVVHRLLLVVQHLTLVVQHLMLAVQRLTLVAQRLTLVVQRLTLVAESVHFRQPN